MPVQVKQEGMADIHMLPAGHVFPGEQMIPGTQILPNGQMVSSSQGLPSSQLQPGFPLAMALGQGQRMPGYLPPPYSLPPPGIPVQGNPPTGFGIQPAVSQPNTTLPAPQQTSPVGVTGTDSESSEGHIDSASVRGAFGWTTVDGVNIPYLLRDDKKYTAVRMVEMKLLSKYPSTYPEELKERPPLMSHYVTAKETELLNEINKEHCAFEFGTQPFTEQDLIVKLSDFEEFYSIVKKHFPEEVLKSLGRLEPKAQITGGWLQVNNTVVPYLLRDKAMFVPLSVIRYAAGLLTDVPVEGVPPEEEECDFLNDMCKNVGLNFSFAKITKFITIETVQRKSSEPVEIQELSKTDPFGQARYKGTGEEEVARLGMGQPAQGQMSLNNVVQQSATMGGGMPMIGMPGMVPDRVGLRPDSNPFWMGPHMGVFPGMGGVPCLPGMHRQMRAPFGVIPGMQQQQYGMRHPGSKHEMNNNHNNNNNNSSMTANGHSRGVPSPLTMNSRPQSCGQQEGTGSRPQSASSTGSLPQRRLSGQSSHGPASSPPVSSASQALQAAQRQAMANGGMMPGPADWQPMGPMPIEYHQLMTQVRQGRIPPNHPAVMSMQQQMLLGRQGHSRALAPSAALGRPPACTATLTTQTDSQQVSHSGAKHSHSQSSKTSTSSPSSLSASLSSSSSSTLSSSSLYSQANHSPNSLRSPTREGKIKAVEFHGKTLSCILKGASLEPHALVEAVARVYFPFCQLDDFQFALQNVLGVSVADLSAEEEKTFITFYGLPVNSLSCNKIVKLNELEEYLPQLKYMFRDKAELWAKQQKEKQGSTAKSKERISIPTHLKSSNVPPKDVVRNSAGSVQRLRDSTDSRDSITSPEDQESNTQTSRRESTASTARRDSTASSGSQDSSESLLPKKMSVNFDTFKKRAQSILRDIMGSAKRTATEANLHQSAMKAPKRLEAALNRLYQNHAMQSPTDSPCQSDSGSQDDNEQSKAEQAQTTEAAVETKAKESKADEPVTEDAAKKVEQETVKQETIADVQCESKSLSDEVTKVTSASSTDPPSTVSPNGTIITIE